MATGVEIKVPVTLVPYKGQMLFTVTCPFCGEKHGHGGGWLTEDWRQQLGWRSADCGGGCYTLTEPDSAEQRN